MILKKAKDESKRLRKCLQGINSFKKAHMTGTTLKEISKALGLSISTVSRALKNHPDISEKTKQKVAELAHTLDYEPNANAISLRTRNNRLFGVIVPSISNFFYDSFISAVEEDSRLHNYNIMILQSGENPLIEEENLKLCRQNRVSGVFACITSQTKDITPFVKLKEQKVPLIFFDKVPPFEGYNKVCIADAESATLAANALIQSGRKSIIALFGNENLSITNKRVNAFKEAIQNVERRINYQIVFCNTTSDAYTLTTDLLNTLPKADGIFCMSDEILCGAMKAVQQKNKSIPKDIAVIALSNGFFPGLYFPEITYVETSGYKLGKAAFARMLECLEDNFETKELTINTTLVKGQSV